MGKEEILIYVQGCDDETVFALEVTPEEKALLDRVAAMSQGISTYPCQARLYTLPLDGEFDPDSVKEARERTKAWQEQMKGSTTTTEAEP